jgi:predicted nucleic acid-binding protein
MDDKPLFIDTNILIYANVATAPLHEQALNSIKTAKQKFAIDMIDTVIQQAAH